MEKQKKAFFARDLGCLRRKALAKNFFKICQYQLYLFGGYI